MVAQKRTPKTKTLTIDGIKVRVSLPSGRIMTMPDWCCLHDWIERGLVKEVRTHVVGDVSTYDWFVQFNKL